MLRVQFGPGLCFYPEFGVRVRSSEERTGRNPGSAGSEFGERTGPNHCSAGSEFGETTRTEP